MLIKKSQFLQNVQFDKTLPASFPSSIPDGFNYPFIKINLGTTGTGKTYEDSQYCLASLQHHDYDGLFELCAKYSANEQYNEQLRPYTLDVFPEQYIDDEYKINTALDSWSQWNLQRMNKWREIRRRFDTFEDFEQDRNINFLQFIEERETKYEPLNYSLIEKPKLTKRKKKTDDDNINVFLQSMKTKEKKSKKKQKTSVDFDIKNVSYQNYIDPYAFPFDEIIPEPEPETKIEPEFTQEEEEQKNYEIVQIDRDKLRLYFNKPPCCIIRVDDMLGTSISKQANNKIINKCINLRHDGFTVLIAIQNIANAISTTIRNNTKVWALHNTVSHNVLKHIYDILGTGLADSLKDFKKFFTSAIDGDKCKFLLVDMTRNPPEIRFNYNFIPVKQNGQHMSARETVNQFLNGLLNY